MPLSAPVLLIRLTCQMLLIQFAFPRFSTSFSQPSPIPLSSLFHLRLPSLLRISHLLLIHRGRYWVPVESYASIRSAQTTDRLELRSGCNRSQWRHFKPNLFLHAWRARHWWKNEIEKWHNQEIVCYLSVCMRAANLVRGYGDARGVGLRGMRVWWCRLCRLQIWQPCDNIWDGRFIYVVCLLVCTYVQQTQCLCEDRLTMEIPGGQNSRFFQISPKPGGIFRRKYENLALISYVLMVEQLFGQTYSKLWGEYKKPYPY